MADKTVTYGVRVKAESNAGEAADSVSALRKQLETSQGAVKAYGQALRNLRGDSDAVRAAKEKLKTAEKAAKDQVSQATLSLLSQGAALRATKAPTDEAGASTNALSAALAKLGGVWGAAAAAAIAFTGAVGYGIISLAKFVFESANALRTMGLFREAATGSAENAAAFGSQIELLAGKVPQSREELNKLSVSLSKALQYSAVSGQGIVDTFNAVAQASAAMGDEAGKKIEDLITRSKRFGRFGMGLFDLEGTGIQFTDVAGQLAKDMGVGMTEAQAMLRTGRVNVNAGAKALRETVEKQFAGINARRMLDLNVLAGKFKDALVGLTSGVDLTPLSSGIGEVLKLFSETTVTGKAMKTLITDFGNAVGTVFKAAGPYVDIFVRTFVLRMLKFESAVLSAAIFIKEKFGVNIKAALDDTSIAATAAKTVALGLEAAVVALAAAGAIFVGAGYAMKASVKAIYSAFIELRAAYEGFSWNELGVRIVDGILNGLARGRDRVKQAVMGLAQDLKQGFKDALGIHSPSKAFEEFGYALPQGVVKGVDRGAPEAQGAVSGMVAPPSAVGIGGGGSAPVTVNVTINVDAGKGGGASGKADVAATLLSPTFKAQLIKALEEIAVGAGLAPQRR